MKSSINSENFVRTLQEIRPYGAIILLSSAMFRCRVDDLCFLCDVRMWVRSWHLRRRYEGDGFMWLRLGIQRQNLQPSWVGYTSNKPYQRMRTSRYTFYFRI